MIDSIDRSIRRREVEKPRIPAPGSATPQCDFLPPGYAATGIRDVAEDAGLTTAALYHHMGSKQDLLRTIMRDAMHELIASARDAQREAEGPAEELAALARAHIVYNGQHILDGYVSDSEIRSLDAPNRPRIVKLRDAYEELWTDVIARGVKSGDFQIDDQHPLPPRRDPDVQRGHLLVLVGRADAAERDRRRVRRLRARDGRIRGAAARQAGQADPAQEDTSRELEMGDMRI